MGARRQWLAVALLLVLAGCGGRKAPRATPPPPPQPAVYHQVRPGETVARIGRAYGVPYEQIARANGLADASRITVGQRLLIPGATHAVELPAPDGLALAPLDRAPAGACPRDALHLQWPVTAGIVTSAFGLRHGNHHDGIDIAAPAGAAVRAAADGEVVYDGALPGYGNMLILRHARGYITVYAHNQQHHATAGARVRCGQLIASVGDSGRATAPNLHFEVRRDNVAYDPLRFLPAPRTAGGPRAIEPGKALVLGAVPGGG